MSTLRRWTCRRTRLVDLAAAAAALAILATSAPNLAAQRVRITVTDSATSQPIAGAVMILLDTAGQSIARNLSDRAGAVVFPSFAGAVRLRALRIGYRPREVSIPVPTESDVAIPMVMAPLPRMLEPVRSVVSAKCTGGKRVLEAYGLVERMRDAFLATIVARETRPASMVLIGYRRSYRSTKEDDSDLTNQVVRVDSLDARPRTYEPVKSPEAFMASGFGGSAALFIAGFGAAPELLAPDAETLMSDEFIETYCFDIADDDRQRPGQLGLAFRRPDDSRQRIDIEGIVWVDTAARALRDVEYEYTSDVMRQRPRSSGRIHFRSFPNGVVLIDSWQISEIRQVANGVRVTSANARNAGSPVARTITVPKLLTAGGALAAAQWSDGTTYAMPLGSARVEVRTEGKNVPVPGIEVTLESSPYVARTDSAGVASFENVYPARYAILAHDSLLAPYKIGTQSRGTIEVGAMAPSSRTVKTITSVEYVEQRCQRAKRLAGTHHLLGRVLDSRESPVRDAEVAVYRRDEKGSWVTVRRLEKTGADGFWFLCDESVEPGMELRAVVTRFEHTGSVDAKVSAKVTILDLRVP